MSVSAASRRLHVVQEGQIIGDKYRIGRRLGRGGMGAVFEATHKGTGGRVALKLVAAADLTQNDEIMARFRREARAAAAIESDRIVRVFDLGSDGPTGMPYMAMELLPGQDLAAAMRRVRILTPKTAVRIVVELLAGLSKAHACGVVHRDIKPGNVFLAESDDRLAVKILDFGIAKVRMDTLNDAEGGLTRTGSVLGSPQYMSPEQAFGHKDSGLSK